MPGESLSKLVRNAKKAGERLPPGHAVSIMAGVLHGLHAAHEAKSERREPLNIVHRYVSPQNLLVGIYGVARVLYFCVAKAALRSQSGRCKAASGFAYVENALRGQWILPCERSDLLVSVTLAPTMPPTVQFLEVTPAPPPEEVGRPALCQGV